MSGEKCWRHDYAHGEYVCTCFPREFICPEDGLPMVDDVFSGEGGATAGLMRAGFCVTAVDNDKNRLKYNPAQHKVEADAIEFIVDQGHRFLFGWGSPTCTGYSRGTVAIPDRIAKYDRQIAATREAFEMTGRPWVIENVEGAMHLGELRPDLLLCGRMFGLEADDLDGEHLTLDRHRVFEASFPIPQPEHPIHGQEQVAGVYGGGRRAVRRPKETFVQVAVRDRYAAKHERKGGYVPRDPGVMEQMLDIDWPMTVRGLQLCIPPVYAEHIGKAAWAHLTYRHANDCTCADCYSAAMVGGR